MTDGVDMPPFERAARYRSLAAAADALALRSAKPAADAYVEMARHWRQLAEQTETAGTAGDGV